MPKKPINSTQKASDAENLLLRAQLDEAEESLRAIRSGDWDALIVSGAGGGEQILTLKQSELRYRRLFEAAQDGILILNAQTGMIEDVNPFLINMLGYSHAELVEKRLWEVGAFNDAEASREAFEALQEDEYIRYENLPLKTKDGRLIQVEIVSNVYMVDGVKVIQCNIRDISDRISAAEALRENEDRYRTIFENSHDAILLSAPDGLILDANPAACQMFDRSLEDLRQVGRTALVDATDPRLPVALHERDLTGKMRSEITMIRADGSNFPADISSTLFTDSQGQMRTTLIIRDNTERRRSEEALRESEREFIILAESMPQMVWITRADGWNIYFNQRWVDYTGLTLEESYGHGWNKPFHPDDTQRAWDAWQNATQNGARYNIECRLRRADGAYTWWLIRGIPKLDAYGNILKWFGTCTDINELKLADAAREHREAELNESQRIARIGSWEWTIATGAVEWSDGMNHILGRDLTLPPPSFATLSQFYTPESWQSLGTIIAQAVETGASYDLEVEMIRADGSTCWTTTRGEAVRDVDGSIVKLRGTALDISQRKQAAVELMAKNDEVKAISQQLWQAAKLATLGELAASVAHELNNPLQTVSLHIEAALAELAADDPLSASLQIAEQETERMATLVASLLQFSRRSTQQVSTLDLRDEIGTALELVQSQLRRREIAVVREFAPDLPTVHADRQQLRQVFLNLFTNASDAMTGSGTLTIRVRSVEEQISIEVADTGQGIAPEDLAKVEEPFFTTKPEGKGTGLGLAICRRIVQEHGGSLHITSEGPGLGATVSVRLPASSTQGQTYD